MFAPLELKILLCYNYFFMLFYQFHFLVIRILIGFFIIFHSFIHYFLISIHFMLIANLNLKYFHLEINQCILSALFFFQLSIWFYHFKYLAHFNFWLSQFIFKIVFILYDNRIYLKNYWKIFEFPNYSMVRIHFW